MSSKIALFGGSGGLGAQLVPLLDEYEVLPLSSKDVDVTDFEQVNAWFVQNKPEIVLNLATLNIDGLAHKFTDEDLTRMIDVNIKGSFNIVRAAIPLMREMEYGRIIIMSSILSSSPIRGTSLYSACKAFNDNLVKTVALENAKYRITCNSIQLGYFDGGLTYKVPEKILEQVIQQIALKRLGEVQELANTVKFLINTEYATGMNLELSGGLHI